MPDKKPKPQDNELKAFIKAGGRIGAEADLNQILKRAVRPKKASKQTYKSK